MLEPGKRTRSRRFAGSEKRVVREIARQFAAIEQRDKVPSAAEELLNFYRECLGIHAGGQLKSGNLVDTVSQRLSKPDNPARDMPSSAELVLPPRQQRPAMILHQEIDVNHGGNLKNELEHFIGQSLARVGVPQRKMQRLTIAYCF
ncbi:hypothetical protein ACJMQP_16040 [Rhodopseudomonas palustris]